MIQGSESESEKEQHFGEKRLKEIKEIKDALKKARRRNWNEKANRKQFIEYLSREENESYVAPVAIEDIPLFSQSIFIHSSVVDYSILGHTCANILKMVPIPAEFKGDYVTVDVKILKYIPLQNFEIQELDFTLKSLSGAYINFIEKEFCEVYINFILGTILPAKTPE